MAGSGRVLVIDDNSTNLAVVGELLERHGYEVQVANSGEMGLVVASSAPPEIVLLDVMMPGGMDGFDTCKALRAQPGMAAIPVLFLSADNAAHAKVTGFGVGGTDYVGKPFQAEELLARIGTHIELARLRSRLQQEVERKTEDVRNLYRQLNDSYEQALQLLSMAGEFRDRDTGNHTRRIGLYAGLLAQIRGEPEEYCRQIELAAPLHDIGKLAIPDKILLKEGPLDEAEWLVMRTHAEAGATLLRRHPQPLFAIAAEIAGCHHERYDGSGYPHNLRGDAIPLSARITTLVDTYDALRARRPYKEAFGHTEAIAVLKNGDGRTKAEHFDPALLNLFLVHHQRFAIIYEQDAKRLETTAC